MIVIGYSFIMVLIAYAQNVGIWLKTLEKTLIAIMIPMYGGMFLLFFKFPDVMYMAAPTNPAGMEKLMASCTRLLPFAPLIFVGALLVGILCTTTLYKRREK